MLGEAGATVYCTGRSVHGRPATPGRTETIEETAELVDVLVNDIWGGDALTEWGKPF